MQRFVKLSPWTYIWTSCITIWIGCFAVFFGPALSQFIDLFHGFGADLPSLTKFIIEKSIPVWTTLVVFFLLQLGLYSYFLLSKTTVARRGILVSSGANVVLHFILIGAMYAPIFKLGSVV